jgi:hypothetical protein
VRLEKPIHNRQVGDRAVRLQILQDVDQDERYIQFIDETSERCRDVFAVGDDDVWELLTRGRCGRDRVECC